MERVSLGAPLLIVEDDDSILNLLSTALGAEGYRTICCRSLAESSQALAHNSYAMILLDLSLPDGDGAIWLQNFRRANQTPVIVLSARLAESDKVTALNYGADDYVSKPFGMPELLARVNANLRRAVALPGVSTFLQFGEIKVDLLAGTVYRSGEPIHLTAKEWAVLEMLARSPGKLIRQRELLTSVWGPEFADDNHYLRIIMSKLRAKLEAVPAMPTYLITEPGIGYRLNTP